MDSSQLPAPPPSAADQRGIALLIAVSVLSLMVVLGLSFALSSITAQKSVELTENLYRSRLASQSGFTKAYQMLAQDLFNAYELDNLFPATKPNQSHFYGGSAFNTAQPKWAGRYYWASSGVDIYGDTDIAGIDTAFHVEFAGVDFTPSTSFAGSVPPSDTFGWLHVYDSSDTYPDDDTPIVSRIAYLIIDESGKIDPGAVCGSDSEGSEVRKGRSPDEINLKNLLSSSTVAAKFQPIWHANGRMPVLQEDTMVSGKWSVIRSSTNLVGGAQSGAQKEQINWDSYYSIFKNFYEGFPTIWTDANVTDVLQNTFPLSYDIEAYYDGEEDKHRFDLGRTDWSSLTVDNLVAEATDFWIYSAGTIVGCYNNLGGIPWLYHSDTPLSSRQQIAANIIDYCDSNDVATSDSPTFSYCGNEKVPYINEIRFLVWFEQDGVTSNYYFRVQPEIEYVNIYNSSYTPDTYLTLRVNIDSTTAGITDTDVTYTIPYNSSFGSTSYIVTGFNTSYAKTFPFSSAANVSIAIRSALLTKTDGSVLDYAFDTTDTSPVATTVNTTMRYISIEVNDPRHNLPSSEWKWWGGGWGSWSSAHWSTTDTGTSGVKNSICNPNPGGAKDAEFVSSGTIQPWTISTAYIRNAPMQSLWELGAIHRAAAWETINLKKFNNNISIDQLRTTGLGHYFNGDAHILSQVKIGSDTEVRGRVNVNTYNSGVLRALLQGITINGTYASPGSGTAMAANDAMELIGNGPTFSVGDKTILAWNGAGLNTSGNPVGNPFRFRGEIVNADYLVLSSLTIFPVMGGVGVRRDAKEEEIIGKIANIITVRQNYFSAIIVSQIVDDLVSGYKAGLRGRYDLGVDKTLALQRMYVVYYRDAHTNKFTAVRREYLDE